MCIRDSAGLDPLKIYEKGLMPDIEKSFKVYEYRNEISLKDFLDKASLDEEEKIGKEFGIALRKLHGIKPTDKIDWHKAFLLKSNQIFYRHGLSEIGDDAVSYTHLYESKYWSNSSNGFNTKF